MIAALGLSSPVSPLSHSRSYSGLLAPFGPQILPLLRKLLASNLFFPLSASFSFYLSPYQNNQLPVLSLLPNTGTGPPPPT